MRIWDYRLGRFAFCFPAPDGAGAGAETPPETPPEGDDKGPTETPPSFDDWLKKNPSFQSEFDRRVTKGLETARAKWESETAEKVSEAERLAKMTAEQKAQHEREKKEKELTDRERALSLKELRATASETLTQKGLPLALLDSLSLENAEKCNASIEAVEKAYRAAVQAGVEERMKGKPPVGGGKAPEADYDKLIDAANASGNLAEAAYYTRLKAMKSKG